ncbi:MAG: type II CRISPR-associated endonuclease Cas1 [Clostridiales bacterium]|nr:type II CRISPR-associated endonuclease Cas1 [Clostridiales bacterium]
MSWRTIVISRRCKLDLKSGYMVVRSDDVKRIVLDEVSTIVIESTAVSLTAYLIAELTERKIKVIFCDNKRNPTAELASIYGCHDCSQKVKRQLAWQEDIKSSVWTEIVSEKIRQQRDFLIDTEHAEESELLQSYIENMEFNDATNREGHAAKVYFNALFGKDFSRSEECVTNAALNYGYSLILSQINREVVGSGYLTQLGLFHDNMFNCFNFSCDLMEPYRVLVDRFVYQTGFTKFETEEKHRLIDLMTSTVKINGQSQYIGNALSIYCHSVFDALNDRDISLIKHYSI